MLGAEEVGERLDAGLMGNVELVELDVSEAAEGAQGFGLLEGGVLGGDGGDGRLATGRVAGGEVDEEGAGVEFGGGVLEGELAD